MRFLFFSFLLFSNCLYSAMGYLGGHPYTTTTAQKVIDFDSGNPPAPEPTRRAQYSYMADSLDKSTSKVTSVSVEKINTNVEYEKVSDSEMVEEHILKKSPEPELGDEVLDSSIPADPIDYVDFDSI